jgi:flagellar protein FlaG
MSDPITSITPATFPTGGGTGAAVALAASMAAAVTPSPPQADASPPAGQPPGSPQTGGADLQAMADALNQRAQDLQTSLHFQVDKITGQEVMSVIDTQTNQVLLQVPSEEALAIAQSLERMQAQLLDQKA